MHLGYSTVKEIISKEDEGDGKEEENEDEEVKEEKKEKARKKTIKNQKKSSKIEEEIREEEVNEDKTNNKAKKASKSKKPPTHQKGKLNQDVEELTITPQLEDPSDEVIDYKSTKSNNRNIIRAAYTKNHALLSKVFTSGKLSTFFDTWGAENDMSALDLIFKNKDKKGLEIFFDSYLGANTTTAASPQCFLRQINTGYNSRYTFGVKVRRVNMARGSREGNNAFVADIREPRAFDKRFYEKIAVMDVDPQMVDILQARLGNSML